MSTLIKEIRNSFKRKYATRHMQQVKPATISLAMIVKNEEEVIARALGCASQCCEEMIVVDTGSTDRTAQIARTMGAKVLNFEWIDDFSAARNFALESCSGDWVLWLDADDVIPDATITTFNQIKHTFLASDRFDTCFVEYKINFKGDCCTFHTDRERLIRRNSGLRWEGSIHECISMIYASKTLKIDNAWIEHRPTGQHLGRNIEQLKKLYDNGDRSYRTLFYLGQDLFLAGENEKAIEALEQFKPEEDGTKWMTYFHLLYMGKAWEQLGNHDKALDYFLDAIKYMPKRAEAWFEAGSIYYSAGDWGGAIPYLSACLHLQPPRDSSFCWYSSYSFLPKTLLSVCLHNIGDSKTAIKYCIDDQHMKELNDPELIKNNLKFFVEGAIKQLGG